MRPTTHPNSTAPHIPANEEAATNRRPTGRRDLETRIGSSVHRAGSSTNGLIWLDSLFAPKTLAGARMVFGETPNDASMRNAVGSHLFLPVIRDGEVHLAKMRFDDSEGTGLFGNRESLLAEWQARLSIRSAAPQ